MFSVVRLLALLRHFSDIKSIKSFPTECSSWAVIDGCTRIVAEDSSCVAAGPIPQEYSTVFFEDPTTFNSAVRLCIYESGASLQYPDGLEDVENYTPFIHITF